MGLVIHKAEPRVRCIRRAVVVTDALPGLIPTFLHPPTESTHLKLDFTLVVAPKKLLPRELLPAVVVLWLAPFLVVRRRRRRR